MELLRYLLMFINMALLLKVSVVLYSNRKLRQGQYTVVTDWPVVCIVLLALVGQEVASHCKCLSSLVYNGSESTATGKIYTKLS